MQELTFEQVGVVAGGSKIDDMERMNEARKASQKNIDEETGGGGEWFTPGTGNVNCCFGIDMFNFNVFNAAQDFGSFIGINGNLERERSERVEAQ